MSAFIQKAFLLQSALPSLTLKRFRGKINIQRPQQPHYKRALVNAVTQPIIPEPTVTEVCRQTQLAKLDKRGTVKVVENHPYEVIIAKEVTNWLSHSKMTMFFHINSINSEEMFKIRVAFFKQNMHVKAYSKSIIKKAVTGTKYESILPLFYSKNCIVFGDDETKIAQVLKIVKKSPQLILLGGIIEDRLLSKTELTNFAALPNITVARAQFVGVLNSAASSIVSNLQSHQTNLCTLLDMHAKSKDVEPESGTKDPETATKEEEPSN